MSDPTHDERCDHKTRPAGVLDVPRLLVVEDDPLQRTLIVRAAEKAGYRAVAVESCPKALHRLETERFSCVTLDLTLEDGDGFDVMRQMANAGCQVPVIVISGMDASARRTFRARARELNVEILQSFPKPVDLAALRISLANLRSATAGLPNLHWIGEIRIAEPAV